MPVSSDEIVERLRAAGWSVRMGKKNHWVAVSPDGKQRTTVPLRREIAVGTLGAIERQTGIKFRQGKRSA